MERNTYKYHFKIGTKVVHTGITNDIDRREQEHQRTFGSDGRIEKIGNATTLLDALQWESEQAKRGKPTRRKRNHVH